MDRKEFIKTCGFACLGGAFLAPFLQGCVATSYFGQNSLNGNELTVGKREFIKSDKNDKKVYRRYVILKNDKLDYPILLHRVNDDNYRALLMLCTHKGCELQLQGDFLLCPCHGSEFSNTGVVQNPPAQENLRTFTTRIDDEHIYISL